MSRLQANLNKLKKSGEKALVLFITAGDPSLKVTREALRFADEAGVDCIEIGVPFSDPLADGPVIQAASFRALKKGVNLKKILNLVQDERRKGLKIPIILMSSLNPVHSFGMKRALAAAKSAGVQGIILPDLPADEAGEFILGSCREDLASILMLTPTTSPAREKHILRNASGFLYYVSLTGVTGERRRRDYPFQKDVTRLSRLARVPLYVGFGVSTPAQASAISRFSDGVIVGSAIVRDLFEHSKTGLSPNSKKWIERFVRAVKSSSGRLLHPPAAGSQ